MTLANRFVRSATQEGMANEDGSCTPRLTRLMVQLARGGVGLKMNSEDFLEGGLSVEDMLQVEAMLEEAGIDVIELSGGTIHSGKYSMVREGKLESEEDVYYSDPRTSPNQQKEVG